jgi:hypothetical protein
MASATNREPEIMRVYTKSELAWELVDQCRPKMRGPELQALFVTLGAGEYDDAIVTALNALHRRKLDFPKELRVHLAEWLNLNPLESRHHATPAMVVLRELAKLRAAEHNTGHQFRTTPTFSTSGYRPLRIASASDRNYQ